MSLTHKEDKQETFKRVTSATIKAVSRRPEAVVNFSPGVNSASGHTVRLPSPAKKMTLEDIGQLRGMADAAALRMRYHNDALHAKLLPKDLSARETFERVEQVRVEALGAQKFPGIATNLEIALNERCKSKGFDRVTQREDCPLSEAVGLLAREVVTGQAIPEIAKDMVDLWRPWIMENGAKELGHLKDCTGDQNKFADALYELLIALDLMAASDGTSQDSDDQGEEEEDSDDNEQDGQDSVDEEENPGEAQAGIEAESGEGDGDGDDEEQSSYAEGLAESAKGDESPAGPRGRYDNWLDDEKGLSKLYKEYTKEFDEIISAEDLCDAEELARLRHQLDQQLSHLQGVVGRLANRLQRKLLAQQTRSWDFDLEEGLLDCGRLARVVVNPEMPLSYKWEKNTEFRDTVVSLLIDNSGSMRGRPITIAAICADILSRTLERCGVKVEVLGFTTKAWKGGGSREKWVNNNKPENPGRLNDLRHIVYKGADTPWRRTRKNLGLMLREGLLKENIDGEALMWAHERLIARPEHRRILMVISDGAPVDDATLSANPGSYLERHLRNVIEWIETRSPVELTAIGIGHDVTRYYNRAVTITDAEELGGTMMQNLAELFDENYKP
ncbi:MAG: cobaltochelatase subunit CobT [Rhodospirillales bacterium]|nr:cobaltochelatase subunit CobT [Rhodospirillales bacterium]